MLALFEENPKRRYMTTPNQDEAQFTIRKQIAQAEGSHTGMFLRKVLYSAVQND